MSTNVSGHIVSARANKTRDKITVRVSNTITCSMDFNLAEYPASAHPLEKIAWLEKKHDEYATANGDYGALSPNEICLRTRIVEAQIAEIEKIIAEPAT